MSASLCGGKAGPGLCRHSVSRDTEMFIQCRCRCRGTEIIHAYKRVPVTQHAVPWLPQRRLDNDARCITKNLFAPVRILLPEQFKTGGRDHGGSNAIGGN